LELTIDQALQKGIEAHKSGQVNEANRFYSLVLKTQPQHPDANHNIGVLAVDAGNFKKAISFLKTALMANPNNAQYWVSYIDTLIKIGAHDDARTMLSQAKERGAKGQVFDQLEKKLANNNEGLSVISSIENFYKNSKSAIVNNAAQGWVFTANFDKQFIEKKSISSDTTSAPLKKEAVLSQPITNNKPSLSAGQIIDTLNNEEKIVKKFNKLKALLEDEDLNIINDSFGQDADTDLSAAQDRTFKSQELNIVIIGGGVTGLYLASIIKYKICNDVNILVLDNRSDKENTRKPFERDWLTQIPSDIVQKYTPPNIRELLQCFGTDGFIGLQLNLLETVLMLSCKDQGVKFYFSPELDYSKLNNEHISFCFDATGGRLNEGEYSSSNFQKNDLKLQDLVKGFKYVGVNPLNNIPNSEPTEVNITLKASGAYHFPYTEKTKIHTNMIKVTGIPECAIKAVHDFIDPRNASNLFYIWKGVLKSEFNEGLVFISLTSKEYDLLTSHVHSPICLKKFLKKNGDILPSLNDNIDPLLQMLVNLDNSEQIKINPPFSYAPHINLNAEAGIFNKRRIFPIGDAYFHGHPKVGNGLWTHLGFINDLVKGFAAAHKKLKRE